jgi:hypothetical protein
LHEPKQEGRYTCPYCEAQLDLTIEELPHYVAETVERATGEDV